MIDRSTDIRSALRSRQRGFFTMPGGMGMGRPSGGNAGFSPLDLPGFKLWFDADDATSITMTGGNASQWNDKSGNNNHATQSTDASRYTVFAEGQNGRTVMTAAGAGCMILTSSVVLPAGGYYAFVAGSNNTASNGTIFISGTTNRYLFDLDPYGGGGLYQTLEDSSAPGIYGLGSVVYNNSAHVLGFVVNSSGSTSYFDSVSQTHATTSGLTLTGLSNYTVGAGYKLNGRIFEIIVGSAELTAEQISQIKSYLKTKWGTP